MKNYFSLLMLALAGTFFFVGFRDDYRTASAKSTELNAIGVGTVYLPIVKTPIKITPQVNAPLFPGSFDWNQTAISWFGQVNSTDNYADVRTGYTQDYLKVKVAVFDRWLWYDKTPTPDTLTDWDAVSLYLKIDGNIGNTPSQTSHIFTGQLNWTEPDEFWKAAWRGDGSTWVSAPTSFSINNGWRGGGGPNDMLDDRGWWVIFEIPFSSLGLVSPPPDGSNWGMGIELFDRDDAPGSSIPTKEWPADMNPDTPSTWGILRFGVPTHTTPAASQTTTVQIRHGLAGATVTDAHVGGGFLCGQQSFPIYFDGWGDENYLGETQFNIQNQHDLADWPCFSKTYITFPLNQIPPGKVIVSANLRLYHNGNSGQYDPDPIPDSYIQILSPVGGWSDPTITWNNAPHAWQNYGGRWVTGMPLGSPPIPWDWDVSRVVSDAYSSNIPARFVLYSSDSAQNNTGKYFLASESGGTNDEKRPTLTVEWGNP